METITLKPNPKQLYQVQTQNSHPRISLTNVFWVKFLRYVEKTPMRQLGKHAMRFLGLLTIVILASAPWFVFGMITAVIGFKSVTVICAALAYLYGGTIMRKIDALWKNQGRKGNQHTFCGVPVHELADFLIETDSFKVEDAVRRLGLAQRQYTKMAESLEKHGVLMRGEKNARVLRPITRENLVLQLREDFPLVWSEERKEWCERNGAMERWALNHDFKQRRIQEGIERKERKLERLDRKVTQSKALAHLFTAQTV